MEDIRPLKAPIDILFFNWAWLLLAALVIAGIWLYYQRRKSVRPNTSPVDTRTPQEIALAELEQLAKGALNAEKHAREFYIKLSDIIRIFIEAHFKVPARERTTFELVRDLKKTETEKDVIRKIDLLLEDSDLVKFAKFSPNKKQMEDSLQLGIEIARVETRLIASLHEE